MVNGMKSDIHILAAIAEYANFGNLGPFASILNGAYPGGQSKPIDHTQIGQGMQLIPTDDINSNPKISSKDYCYLYKDGVQISDMPYRRGGLFSGFGTDKKYCMLIQHPKLRKNPKEGITITIYLHSTIMSTITKKGVVALIFNQDKTRVLGVSRKYDHSLFGLVGGGVEPGEDWADALVREVLEETGLEITSMQFLFERTDPGEGCEVLSKTYLCTVRGTINPGPGEGVVKYVDWETLYKGPFGVYNKALNKFLKENNYL